MLSGICRGFQDVDSVEKVCLRVPDLLAKEGVYHGRRDATGAAGVYGHLEG
jgi:hypothetical protein